MKNELQNKTSKKELFVLVKLDSKSMKIDIRHCGDLLKRLAEWLNIFTKWMT